MMRRQKLLALIVSLLPGYVVSQDIQCSLGWSGGVTVIPSAKKNDGYCDCPFDGLDEPNTAACSGSAIGGWAGIQAATDHSPTYKCPHQPKLQLPLSRLNDGICDCCDGSDETDLTVVSCPDKCHEVLAEERAAREKVIREFQIGYEKRQSDLAVFQTLVQKTRVDIEALDSQLGEKKAKLKAKKAEIDQLKGKYMQQRFQAVSEVVQRVSSSSKDDDGIITGLLEPLTTDEIINFIHLSCQVAGEMEDAADESTCVPLRLAGLDAALLWDDENLDTGSATLYRMEDDSQFKKLAGMLALNAAGTGRPVWSGAQPQSRSKTNYRRRLDDAPPHYAAGEDDEDDDDDDDDDYHNGRDEEKTEAQGKRKELMDSVQATAFSKTRVKFMNRADKVIELIQSALATSDEEESSDDKKEEPLGTSGAVVDPAAFQMVRSSLSRRQEGIRRGYKYALSSLVLIGSLQETADDNADKLRSDVTRLAVGTIFHGKIGSDQLWQILQFVLPELSDEVVKSLAEEQRTCSSPLTGACPPRSIERTLSDGRTLSIPSQPLLSVGEAFCSKLVDEALTGVCAKDEENTIPTNVPDGFYGYFIPQPRNNNSADELAKVFAPLDSVQVNRAVMDDLESQRDALDTEKKDLDRQLHDLEDQIGGRDSSQFGANGELHSFKDTCHSVEAGKYIYEVCVFGAAKQKERDGSGSGGTDLGHWEGIFIDEESGQRVMKWTNGARCWNGPSRSAIVYLTCGVENKVLSAEEPETCVYQLEMESYMACDEAYKAKHDL